MVTPIGMLYLALKASLALGVSTKIANLPILINKKNRGGKTGIKERESNYAKDGRTYKGMKLGSSDSFFELGVKLSKSERNDLHFPLYRGKKGAVFFPLIY